MLEPISKAVKNSSQGYDYIGIVTGISITVGGFLVKMIGQWLWKKFSRTLHKVTQLETKVKIMDADIENTKNILHEMRGEVRTDIKEIRDRCAGRHEK